MKSTPSPSAVAPERMAASRSRPPTAWPTRTAAADDMPRGTMNVRLARFRTIWCAASEMASSLPASAVAAENTPTLKRDLAGRGKAESDERAQPRPFDGPR